VSAIPPSQPFNFCVSYSIFYQLFYVSDNLYVSHFACRVARRVVYDHRRITVRAFLTGAAGQAAWATDKWAPSLFYNFKDFQSPKH
jgi:hypothetical protein